MADSSRRTAQEREEARREREAARAARDASQRPGYDDEQRRRRRSLTAAATGSADPGASDGSRSSATRRRQVRPRPTSAGRAMRRPRAGGRAACHESRRPPNGDQSGNPPIKSFPSPPDPDFYLPEDELEMPSGTKRVSRLGNRQGPVRARPARRRHQVKPRKRTDADTAASVAGTDRRRCWRSCWRRRWRGS